MITRRDFIIAGSAAGVATALPAAALLVPPSFPWSTRDLVLVRDWRTARQLAFVWAQEPQEGFHPTVTRPTPTMDILTIYGSAVGRRYNNVWYTFDPQNQRELDALTHFEHRLRPGEKPKRLLLNLEGLDEAFHGTDYGRHQHLLG